MMPTFSPHCASAEVFGGAWHSVVLEGTRDERSSCCSTMVSRACLPPGSWRSELPGASPGDVYDTIVATSLCVNFALAYHFRRTVLHHLLKVFLRVRGAVASYELSRSAKVNVGPTRADCHLDLLQIYRCCRAGKYSRRAYARYLCRKSQQPIW
jgi:hypothetical protein